MPIFKEGKVISVGLIGDLCSNQLPSTDGQYLVLHDNKIFKQWKLTIFFDGQFQIDEFGEVIAWFHLPTTAIDE